MQLSHVSNSKQPALSYQTHFDRPRQKNLNLSEMCISGLARRARIYGSKTSAWSSILRMVAYSRKWSNISYYHMQTWVQVHATTCSKHAQPISSFLYTRQDNRSDSSCEPGASGQGLHHNFWSNIPALPAVSDFAVEVYLESLY